MRKALAALGVLFVGLVGTAAAQDYGYGQRGEYREEYRGDRDRRDDDWRDGGWQDDDYDRGGRRRSGLAAFDYTRFEGARIFISEYEPNLGDRRGRNRFNDRIESIDFRPGQRWLICSDANFRGRCLVLDRPIGNLRQIGMANTISSIRRLR